jgi:hypothetical protein
MKLQLPQSLSSLKALTQAANQKADAAAEIMAKKCTELTGRQIQGPQLKSAAIRIGGIAMGFGAVMAMANIAANTVGPGVASGDGEGGGKGDDPNGHPTPDGDAVFPSTGDFEGDVGMFFAQNGVAVHEMTPWVSAEGDVSWE